MTSTIYFLPDKAISISKDQLPPNEYELTSILGYSSNIDIESSIRNDRRFDSYKLQDAWMLSTRRGLIILINDSTQKIEEISHGGIQNSSLLKFVSEYKIDPRSELTPLLLLKKNSVATEQLQSTTKYIKELFQKNSLRGVNIYDLNYDEFISFVKNNMTDNGYVYNPLLTFYFGHDFFVLDLDEASDLLSSNQHYQQFGTFGAFLMDCKDELHTLQKSF